MATAVTMNITANKEMKDALERCERFRMADIGKMIKIQDMLIMNVRFVMTEDPPIDSNTFGNVSPIMTI